MAEEKKTIVKKVVKAEPPVLDLNELNKFHREGLAKRKEAEVKK